jgi:HD superfamily phosphodiesterase
MDLLKVVKSVKKLDQEERRKDNSPPLVFQELLIKKTKKLCRQLKADENLALVGAYLMDIKIGQAFREGRVTDHVRMSLKAARSFLTKFDLSKEIQEKIENIIQSHHKTVPYQSLEAEIVANADCFKFLHPKGAIFFLTNLGKRGLKFPEALDYFEKKIEEKKKIISLKICQQEAEKYYQLLRALISSARSSS